MAIGTLIVTEIYQRMLALEPKAFDWEKVYAERLPLAQYKQIVQQDFAEAWEALYSPHWDKLKNQELARRTGELVVPNWNRIQEEVPKSLLPIDSIREYLSVLGLCQNPQELGIEKEVGGGWSAKRQGNEAPPLYYHEFSSRDGMPGNNRRGNCAEDIRITTRDLCSTATGEMEGNSMHQSAVSATKLFYNARFITLDPSLPAAEAMALAGDRILAVGKLDELLPLASCETQRIDLEGQAVVPGFNDSHMHLLYWGLGMMGADLTTVRSVSEMIRLGQEFAQNNP